MFRKTNGLALFILATVLFIFNGCNLPGSEAPQKEKPPEALLTEAAKTVIAELTLSAPPPATNTQTTIKEEPSKQPADIITPSPQETSTEETQPQPTATRTPENEFPVISAKVNTNCRAGADPSFDVLGYLLVGETSDVHGQDPWGYWWYIENPDHPGKFCWIWRGTTEVQGDTSNVPVKQPPPTYTPTNTATFTPTPTEGTPYP